MHFCYILHSAKLNRYYVGESSNVNARLQRHNNIELNRSSTRAGIPWEVRLIISCENRSHALRVERHIKRMKSKIFIENLQKYPELLTKIVSENQ